MNPNVQRKIKNLENIERFPPDHLFEYLPLKKSDRVLDLGAGTGYISLPLAEQVQSVCAVDYDEDILKYLEKAAGERNITNIEYVAGNFKDIPLENESFDKAIASISLHEVSPLAEALQEIYRVLKDNGLFLCIELEKTEKFSGPRVSAEEMEVKIREAGFSIVVNTLLQTQVANQPVYVIVAQKNK
ncbi:class I SAM-dependent methyltransferase [Paenibacillus lutrae]|uniref:Methyltransferase domain-containing protein n=1 Tax=Paenibacillus lutrae TaxID=2078573 RepID=A0A7X3FEK6_9BACL|nr:class I SAM-dependent methyltransferase [Paenibacillus lutrae]MVO98245.1 methyltransferase domain-containing protein [Paenibacillus lutrae]